MVSRPFKSLGMDQPIDKPLIRKFIAGACSETEALAVNRYLESPEGEALFNEVLKDQWEEAAGFRPDDAELSKWKRQLYHTIGMPHTDEAETTLPKRIKFFTRYAAIWIVAILGMGTYAAVRWNAEANPGPMITEVIEEKTNPYGQRSSFLLSDSTRVYLGAGSKLSFTRHFSGKQRTVRLTGEAYFEVTKNAAKPFVIYSGAVRTMVLGTSFKINAFRGKPLTVAVTTGKVRVDQMLPNQQLKALGLLTPGHMLTYHKGKATESMMSVADTEKWKTGLLVFKATPLHELTAEIGRWYNVSIIIKRKPLSDIPLSVSLDANVPINKLLDGLSSVGNFRYKLKDGKVIIY
jgi:transmembrane sensor